MPFILSEYFNRMLDPYLPADNQHIDDDPTPEYEEPEEMDDDSDEEDPDDLRDERDL
jgi:hypothetical protein